MAASAVDALRRAGRRAAVVVVRGRGPSYGGRRGRRGRRRGDGVVLDEVSVTAALSSDFPDAVRPALRSGGEHEPHADRDRRERDRAADDQRPPGDPGRRRDVGRLLAPRRCPAPDGWTSTPRASPSRRRPRSLGLSVPRSSLMARSCRWCCYSTSRAQRKGSAGGNGALVVRRQALVSPGSSS